MTNRVVLIDLDGTLINTASDKFKPMKDGIIATDLSAISLLKGSQLFLKSLVQLGFTIYIVSDSHPRYVNAVHHHFFAESCKAACYLADKPNTQKVLTFLEAQGVNPEQDEIVVIGDTYLDIQMGRGLQAVTILVELYTAQNIDVRDGIGDSGRHLKSGPTYHTKSYAEAIDILRQPNAHLLALEARFQNAQSSRDILLGIQQTKTGRSIYTALARQAQGQSDKYNITKFYFEFSRADRSAKTLQTFAAAAAEYIQGAVETYGAHWDYFTYMPDKVTTVPPHKMRELAAWVGKKISIPMLQFLEWNKDTQGSTRTKEHRVDREQFVAQNLGLINEEQLRGKNVIILDDQYTTGATAKIVASKLRLAGATDILFVSLFYLVDDVESNKICPQCGKKLQVKINRATGGRFYTCLKPDYGGNGCGYSENIFDPETSKICPRCGKMMIIKTRKSDGHRFYSCVPPRYKGDGCGYIEDIVRPQQSDNVDSDVPF